MANNLQFGGQNVGSSWGPPSGMAALIAQDRNTVFEVGRNLAATSGGFGASMDRFAAAVDQQKRIKEAGKAADQSYKVAINDPNLAKFLPPQEAWDNLSNRDKAATFTGALKGVGQMELMAEVATDARRRKGEAEAPAAIKLYSEMAQADTFFERPFDQTAALGAVAAKYPEAVRSDTFSSFARMASQDPIAARKLALDERKASIEEKRVDAYGRQVDQNSLGAAEPMVEVETKDRQGNTVKRKIPQSQWEAEQANKPKPSETDYAALLTELRARKAAGATKVDLDQLQRANGIKGIDTKPWWGGNPIDEGIAYLESKLGAGKASQPPPPVPPQPGGRVMVTSPDGRKGYIPAAQLDAALKQGYKRAQ